ncbi:MAG: hypothetical protein EBS55_10070, partial [Flavobacteriaceae bacterium]|nr:hypothetical protein [Flavobacteriaceae bacterium]
YDLLISRISDNMKKMEGKKKYADLYASAEKKLKEYTSQKESSLKILKSYNIETEDQFNEYDKSVSLNFMRLSIMNQYTLSSKANGVGDYNFDVPDGTYYVLIKSNSRKGTNVSEVLGKVFFKKIKVSKSKTEDISVNFDI